MNEQFTLNAADPLSQGRAAKVAEELMGRLIAESTPAPARPESGSSQFNHALDLLERRRRPRAKGKNADIAQQIARPIPQPATGPLYSCALWSDGILEVQCDGRVIAEIPKEAGDHIAVFIASLGRGGKVAA